MKKHIQLIIFLGIFSGFQLILGNDNQDWNNREKFLYEKLYEAPQPKTENATQGEFIVSDTITNDIFTTGITKIKITEVTKDNETFKIKETWRTKNPSYLTWVNIILATLIGHRIWFHPLTFNIKQLEAVHLQGMSHFEKTLYETIKDAAQNGSASLSYPMPKEKSDTMYSDENRKNFNALLDFAKTNGIEETGAGLYGRRVSYDSATDTDYIYYSFKAPTLNSYVGDIFFDKK